MCVRILVYASLYIYNAQIYIHTQTFLFMYILICVYMYACPSFIFQTTALFPQLLKLHESIISHIPSPFYDTGYPSPWNHSPCHTSHIFNVIPYRLFSTESPFSLNILMSTIDNLSYLFCHYIHS